MKDKDPIKDLFSQRLSDMESAVNPSLWNGIQSQIVSVSSVAAPVAKGLSVLSKLGIAAASVSLVVGSIYYFSPNGSTDVVLQGKTEIQSNEPVKETKEVDKLLERPSVTKQISEKTTTNIKITPQTGEQEITINKTNSSIKSPLIVKEASSTSNTGANTPFSPSLSSNGNKISSVNSKPESKELTQIVQDEKSPKEVIGFISKIPNVITPNGDMDNDYLFIETKNLKEFIITVMDKNNKVLFKSEDPSFKWNAVDVPSGSDYFYIITAVDLNGNKINKFSSLSIIRN